MIWLILARIHGIIRKTAAMLAVVHLDFLWFGSGRGMSFVCIYIYIYRYIWRCISITALKGSCFPWLGRKYVDLGCRVYPWEVAKTQKVQVPV